MTPIHIHIRRHAYLVHFALTFLLSWGALLALIGPGGFVGARGVSTSRLPLLFLAILTGPSIAGLLMTGLVHGQAGLRRLARRLVAWRADLRWYAVALLTAPILMIVTILLLTQLSPAYRPTIFTAEDKIVLLLSGIAGALAAGILEEIGWTGFATPEVRQRRGLLASGLLVGLMWGAWHYPLFAESSMSVAGLSPVLYLAVLLFSVLPAYRVLMVWLYDHTDSLLLVIIMHASLTGSTLTLQPTTTGMETVIYDLVLATLLWLIVGALLLAERKRTGQKSKDEDVDGAARTSGARIIRGQHAGGQ